METNKHEKHVTRRLATVGGLTVAAVLALGGPAWAHVSVDPGEVPGGGHATINFKVPNERDNASTTKLEITLPTDHPVASAMPEPVSGWDIDVETGELDEPIESHGSEIREAPVKITWSGGEIEPGTFQRFPVSVGTLPEDADELVFKAIQTYDNDEVVRWIEIPRGDDEPDFPAPVLALSESEGGHGHGAGDDEANGDDDAEVSASTSDDEAVSATDTTARVLGGLGLAVGVGGVAYGVLVGRRRDRVTS